MRCTKLAPPFSIDQCRRLDPQGPELNFQNQPAALAAAGFVVPAAEQQGDDGGMASGMDQASAARAAEVAALVGLDADLRTAVIRALCLVSSAGASPAQAAALPAQELASLKKVLAVLRERVGRRVAAAAEFVDSGGSHPDAGSLPAGTETWHVVAGTQGISLQQDLLALTVREALGPSPGLRGHGAPETRPGL